MRFDLVELLTRLHAWKIEFFENSHIVVAKQWNTICCFQNSVVFLFCYFNISNSGSCNSLISLLLTCEKPCSLQIKYLGFVPVLLKAWAYFHNMCSRFWADTDSIFNVLTNTIARLHHLKQFFSYFLKCSAIYCKYSFCMNMVKAIIFYLCLFMQCSLNNLCHLDIFLTRNATRFWCFTKSKNFLVTLWERSQA